MKACEQRNLLQMQQRTQQRQEILPPQQAYQLTS
jgi:hypothetical protein